MKARFVTEEMTVATTRLVTVVICRVVATFVAETRFVSPTILVRMTTFVAEATLVTQARFVIATKFVTCATLVVVMTSLTVAISSRGGRNPAGSAGKPPGPVGKLMRAGLG